MESNKNEWRNHMESNILTHGGIKWEIKHWDTWRNQMESIKNEALGQMGQILGHGGWGWGWGTGAGGALGHWESFGNTGHWATGGSLGIPLGLGQIFWGITGALGHWGTGALESLGHWRHWSTGALESNILPGAHGQWVRSELKKLKFLLENSNIWVHTGPGAQPGVKGLY